MRREVGTVEGSERRLQRAPAGIGLRVLLLLGVAAEATGGLRKVQAPLYVSLLRKGESGEQQKQKPRRSGAWTYDQSTAIASAGRSRGSRRRPCRPRRSGFLPPL